MTTQNGTESAVGPPELAAVYFDAWQRRDFARLRSVLADDVDFSGPLAQVKDGDACVKGIEGMSQITTGIEVRKVFADGSDVLTWFVLSTSITAPVPVANWMHVEDGKISRINVAFDARGFGSPS